MPFSTAIKSLRVSTLASTLLAAGLGLSTQAQAWGALGHQTVGDIAAQLIKGTHAEREVQRILGTTSLHDISVWDDCVKGIDPAADYRYTVTGRYHECAVFENDPAELARMADYVRRNNSSCDPKPGEESCHKQYHYADAALERGHYELGEVGTSDHDVVGAINASMLSLQGRKVPAPFSLTNEREALALLVHTVGDLHQPLHVGSIYLDEKGQRVDPDRQGDNPQAHTVGGNALAVMGPKGPGGNLHGYWDNAPTHLTPEMLAALPEAARAVPPSAGEAALWAARWASESVGEASKVFDGVQIGERQQTVRGSRWVVTLPEGYEQRTQAETQQQLARAGARLAQLLQAIWP